MTENLPLAAAQLTAALADPAGTPSHPVIFLILGVVTFALHIGAVAVLLGSTGVALYGRIKGGEHWSRLSSTMAFTAKAATGAAIVLGVAPLLFVQVIYDPFWYSSSMISAVWTLVFLGLLLVGYLALYRVHSLLHSDHGEALGSGKGRTVFWLAAALVLFAACGALMHSLSNQALFPTHWLDWYAPQGQVDASGRSLNYFLLPRLLFFFALALPVTSAWIYGMRRWVLSKHYYTNEDGLYSDFLEKVAYRLAAAGGVSVAVTALWWMLSLPAEQAWFTSSAWPYVALVPVLYFLAMPYIQKRRRLCVACNYMVFIMTVVMTLVLASAREALRVGTLFESAGWNPLALPVHWDIPSTAIFFVTFLAVGGTSLAYIFISAWSAGLATASKPGAVWTPSAKLERLGTWAVALLGLWIIGYFVIGAALVLA